LGQKERDVLDYSRESWLCSLTLYPSHLRMGTDLVPKTLCFLECEAVDKVQECSCSKDTRVSVTLHLPNDCFLRHS
jgi:hypothetical protein